VSSAQSITDSYLFKAFGEELLVSGSTADIMRAFGMYGYQRDEASRLWVRARALDVVKGRWDSRDPIGFRGSDWNLYRNVGNEPVNRADPTGLACQMYVLRGVCSQTNGVPVCHAYIAFGIKCNGHVSAGFWPVPAPAIPGHDYPGIVYMPDPDTGGGTCVRQISLEPAFETALCCCVLKSMAHPPRYLLKAPGFYMCVNWVLDMWECAAPAVGTLP